MIDWLTRGVAGAEAPARPWATLLRPLPGLDAILIGGVTLKREGGTLRSQASSPRLAYSDDFVSIWRSGDAQAQICPQTDLARPPFLSLVPPGPAPYS